MADLDLEALEELMKVYNNQNVIFYYSKKKRSLSKEVYPHWEQKSSRLTQIRRGVVHVLETKSVIVEVAVALAKRNITSTKSIIKEEDYRVGLQTTEGPKVRILRRRKMKRKMKAREMKMLLKYKSARKKHYKGS